MVFLCYHTPRVAHGVAAEWAAALSRLCIFAFWDPFVVTTDAVNDASPAHQPAATFSRNGVSGLGAWDGVHLTGIASSGYQFEHSFAFQPLYPLLCAAAR